MLQEAGYETIFEATHPHRAKIRRFERARPNQLWQTDLITFMLKRQNRRLHLVAFLDDHSRFIVSFGLHASASTSLVIEALEAGIADYGPPEELLTDNGPQYVTWRGKSRFTKQLEKRGIKQIIAKPKRPQTLGKIERFWGTLWRELVETALFADLADARDRIGHFIDYYNFQRTHTGIGGLVPADRFFSAAQDVLRTLKERVAANALELARHGRPREPFYVTGQVSGLRCLFPEVPRCVPEDLLTRYRRVWRRRYAPWGFRLTWHHAGRVWAMDHSEAPQPVDGIYPYLFAVRDLASSQQLAWHPVRTVTAEETEPILNELFSQHGAPLVLKCDNGSAFIAEDLRKSVRGEGTAQLFSPPRRPSYNGALERSNSTMKKYTHQHAVSDGHPSCWTSADLEHSRQLANTISRPWGHHGPTPDEVWQARESISVEERAKFQAELTKQRTLALDDLGLADTEQPLSFSDQARCDRLAMRRALEELGYLTLERVRCPSNKPKRKSREKLEADLRKMTNDSTPIANTMLASLDQRAHDDASDDQRLAMLALADRIQADDAPTFVPIEPQHASQQIPSAHHEWAILSWPRRLITPLISLVKAAKIKQ